MHWEEALVLMRETYEEDPEIGEQELVMLGEALMERRDLRVKDINDNIYHALCAVEDFPSLEMTLSYMKIMKCEDCNPLNFSSNMVSDLKTGLERDFGKYDDLPEMTEWVIGCFIKMINSNLEEVAHAGEISLMVESLSWILDRFPGLRVYANELVINLIQSTDFSQKRPGLDIIENGYSTEETICFMTEYFRDPSECNTFFAVDAVDAVAHALTKERNNHRNVGERSGLSEPTIQASKSFLKVIDDAMPLARIRKGHAKIMGRALFRLVRSNPEMADLMSPQQKTEVRKYAAEIEKKKSGSDRYNQNNNYIGSDYSFLSYMYESLTQAQIERLERYIEDGWIDEGTRRMLKHLFGQSNSNFLSENIFLDDGEVRQVWKCISKNRVVLEMMNAMIGDSRYRFQLGVLLTMVDFSDLPERLQRRIRAETVDSEQKLKLKHEHWGLCDEAEPRMVDAMYNRGIEALADNCLCLKFKGKLSAICLKTFKTKKGFTFLEGNWYTLVDEETRDRVLKAHYRGINNSVVDLNNSEWALMRAVKGIGENTAEELMDEIRRVFGESRSARAKKFEVERG